MFNARKVYAELNCFEGLHRSKLLLMIVTFCLGFQVVGVSTFGDALAVCPLSPLAWFFSAAIAAIVVPLGVLSRLVPLTERVVKRRDQTGVAARNCVMEKLSRKLEQEQLQMGTDNGNFLRLALRAHAQSRWRQVQAQRVKTLRVVNAFRRAGVDRDMRSAVSRDIYHHFLQFYR
ncbi:Ca2+ transporting ATPase, plasma membrane [Trypanosoma rangeli]|uniref:Ca2+ transporting ATPase, plasma membrane n=1 Tax=Trypanosoma rangeli TaxID=5698 RepID=A0A422MVN4_TRYRA|nr:Ca2+ transporting ATPase, plasma membrane [Trypanosoma rangeli]RNE97267.1 Ca2+ transporting ATPase, plasma membrane [Trypanosoma rangeli]|eukprot:RNE97267.1 Ca2+ transporting ATPase, plasma membrane [Trypanosoma rangeli]